MTAGGNLRLAHDFRHEPLPSALHTRVMYLTEHETDFIYIPRDGYEQQDLTLDLTSLYHVYKPWAGSLPVKKKKSRNIKNQLKGHYIYIYTYKDKRSAILQ